MRREIGDRVWVQAGAGFGRSRGEWVKIVEEPGALGCMVCNNADCNEYNNVQDERGGYLYHVSECQMFDQEEVKV